ncbi:SIMPL domain-containing protein [Novosphingobium sp. 9]|uniref:SIMPL domain-containing protein n=1 Tax=Novosphingobium sp. 9 TaxID=2025349 RepID=UPI0021B665C0|nr:SIMPL domain-containing protein [Novosphingobium sp. 9]
MNLSTTARIKTFALASAGLLAAALPFAAQAQSATDGSTIAAGHTMLTINAEGSSTRTPDMASFSSGVTTQGKTASEALTANARKMSQVIAALKRAGVADRDVQTSNLNLSPVYSQPARNADGSYQANERTIVGYEATNTVSVRQRDLAAMGKVIDALVTAGANQIDGPNFQLSEPDAAQDEARLDAMKAAAARAKLYAGAAGLHVVRVISISESGGGSPVAPMMFVRKAAMDAAPSTPVAAGELETRVNVTVQYELAP